MIVVYGIGLLLAGLFAINAVLAYQAKHIEPLFWSTFYYQLKLLPLLFATNLMIGYGIKYCYKSFGSLTVALSLSKCLEILICVVMGYWFLKEIPTWKTYLGLAVIAGGFIITKWK
ncbi:hypothetical protein [Paenibacillus sp. UNC451MF]|uniref:hypothetical protein n=1 Tax=Paenibacillus sp. UNC451MF TaxID=1449063 RepID=UPI0004912FC4|nr:hypothetical protein [Paenibacillus sp. UNC451MF]